MRAYECHCFGPILPRHRWDRFGSLDSRGHSTEGEIMKRLLFILCLLVLAACGGENATDTGDDTSPATTPTTSAAPTTTVAATEETTTTQAAAVEETTTTEVAAVVPPEQSATIAAYETAWNEGNEDAFRALFLPDAVIEDPWPHSQALFGVDWFVEQSAGRRMAGITLSIDNCGLSGSGEAVVCEAEFDGAVPVAMNLVPWRDRYTVSFEDGLITDIAVACAICWNQAAEEQFAAWVKTVGEPVSGLNKNYVFIGTAEKAAYWLEWAPKWQEAGRP